MKNRAQGVGRGWTSRLSEIIIRVRGAKTAAAMLPALLAWVLLLTGCGQQQTATHQRVEKEPARKNEEILVQEPSRYKTPVPQQSPENKKSKDSQPYGGLYNGVGTDGLSYERSQADGMKPYTPPPPPGKLVPQPSDEKGENFNTEGYNNIVENQFVKAAQKPLSTFSIDVDNASYANVRRFLNNGQRPPIDAVRIEEMINYFSYNYAQPVGPHPFNVVTEVAACPWKPEHQLVLVALQGKQYSTAELPPSNLVFLIDVSGSMGDENKLPLLKSSFRLLVQQLRPADRVAIVVYAGAAGLVLPSTPGNQKETILAALDNLQAGGSTAGGAGIRLAYQVAQENFLREGNNRVILATDGDFNVGASSDADMIRLVEEKRQTGVYLTCLGFGMGNYKDGKMEQIADKGNGNYAYIDNLQEAKKYLVGQLAGTLFTIAKDVKLQLEFNPAVVQAYRLIGYENRVMRDEDFRDDAKDAGELGSGHTVTALYEVIPVGVKADLPDIKPLKYQEQPRITPQAQHGAELLTVALRYKQPSQEKATELQVAVKNDMGSRATENLRWAAAVAGFGMLLRGSQFKGNCNYELVQSLAGSARGTDADGYRAEFIRLVGAARNM
jgi:Ca-activated chloride channel family protein